MVVEKRELGARGAQNEGMLWRLRLAVVRLLGAERMKWRENECKRYATERLGAEVQTREMCANEGGWV